MSKIKNDIIKELVELKILTTYHFICYVREGIYSSEDIKNFRCKKQNINKTFKELESIDIIQISRVEGKKIYWKLNTSPRLQVKGQLKLEC